MELTSQQDLPVSQQQAWDALNDTEVLKACIPGCESITPTGENAYEVLITASVGPVKARFKGRLQLADLDPPRSYTLQFDGQGGPAGFGKGSAQVRLEPKSANACVLHYSANATVGGKLAQVGSRLVDMAAQKMAGEFFGNFDAQLRARHPSAAAPDAPAPPAAKAGWWARFMAWLRGRPA
jgi:uncharacterized protein